MEDFPDLPRYRLPAPSPTRFAQLRANHAGEGALFKVNPVKTLLDGAMNGHPPMWNISTFRFLAVSWVRISE